MNVILVAIYLVVGLWPFAFLQPNRVEWIGGERGLSFRPKSIAFASEPLPASPAGAGWEGFTIEMDLEPGAEQIGGAPHFLTIHDGKLPSSLVLGQWKDGLVVRFRHDAQPTPRGYRETGARGVLRPSVPVILTLRGEAGGMSFFTNGVLVRRAGIEWPRSTVLRGRLVIGDGAAGNEAWTGIIRGLAIHGEALSSQEIASRSAHWQAGTTDLLRERASLIAFHAFAEGTGRETRDESGTGAVLRFPEVYRPVQTVVLQPFWRGGTIEFSDRRDSVINVLGFVPFGFCYLLQRWRRRPDSLPRQFFLVVLAGLSVSLTIELIQVGLPGRDSSLRDLVCNSLGTLLGALSAVGWAWFKRPAMHRE